MLIILETSSFAARYDILNSMFMGVLQTSFSAGHDARTLQDCLVTAINNYTRTAIREAAFSRHVFPPAPLHDTESETILC